jgi:uncharacterized protein (TIGR03435 family)
MRVLAFLFCAAVVLPAQVFEVASIKPGVKGADHWGWREGDAGLTTNDAPIRGLVTYAYDVKDYQVVGGPKWMDSDPYTIVAKLPPGTPKSTTKGTESDPRLMAAAQALLADRFHMVMHREKKEVAGFALVVAKTGLRLKPVEGEGGMSSNFGNGRAEFRHCALEYIADILAHIVGHPVVDQSGIAGAFDVKLEWAPDGSTDGRPSIFAALQDVGLKLEGKKVPVDLIVIDRMEKPTEN